VRVIAPAKLNIYLRVLGERPDGYHEISTLMIPVNLYDELYIEPCRKGIQLKTEGMKINDEDNLAGKAARLFIDHTSINKGVSIHLIKHIPDGTGLGGGSSDAANVLTAMNNIFDTGLSETMLMSIAREIGTDCPFFILKKPFIMASLGDVPQKKVYLKDRSYLIVIPPFKIKTSTVYSLITTPLTPEREKLNMSDINKSDMIAPEDWLMNDLEKVAFDFNPQLADIKKELTEAGAMGALMTGSGSAVFGVFSDSKHMLNSMKYLNMHDNYLYLCTTILKGG